MTEPTAEEIGEFVVSISNSSCRIRARNRSRAKYLAALGYADAFDCTVSDVFTYRGIFVSRVSLSEAELVYPRSALAPEGMVARHD